MTDQLSDEQIDELKDAFNIFGKNVGFISMKDLPALLKTIGPNPAEEDTRNLFGEVRTMGQSYKRFTILIFNSRAILS